MPRGTIPANVMRVVWVRCGGRCFLCNEDLLVGDIGDESVRTLEELAGRAIGDAAHIVGATDSPSSPRGQDDPGIADRESADNLVLACPTHHRQADTPTGRDVFDIETLRDLKRRHEERIAIATATATNDRTMPVRVFGQIEGGPLGISVNDCAHAILRHESRLPGWSDVRYDRGGLEIDLRNIPFGDGYYAAACAAIDARVEDFKRWHADGRLDRISLFAAAKIPILVHLGHALDDGIATTTYQRHKVNGSWEWPAVDTHPTFTATTPDLLSPSEVVLLVGITALPDIEMLPGDVSDLPRWSLCADEFGDEVLDSATALEDFERAVRVVYTLLDNSPVTRIHLVAAVPVSAAVTLGRVLDRSHHVPMNVYARTPLGYVNALEVQS